MRRYPVILIALLTALFALTACGGEEETPVAVGPTATLAPTATALPPLPTLPVPGTEGNPLLVLLSVPGAQPDTDDALSARFTDTTGLVVDVRVIGSYDEAREALCLGQASVVALDAFSTLSAIANGCGEPYYLLEADGETGVQGQFVARDVFAPRFYQGAFCRPSADSIEGWIVPRLVLLSQGVDPSITFQEVIDTGTDEAVIQSVLARDCGLGATTAGAEVGLEDLPGYRFLQVLQTLPVVPNTALLLSADLNDLQRAAFLDAVDSRQSDIADRLGGDDLVDATVDDFAELRDLFESAGVDIASLPE